MAGMLAARVLAEHFDQVILLERDDIRWSRSHAMASRRHVTCTPC